MAASINQLIKRYYTTRLDKEPELSVFDLFEWKRVDVHMEDYKTGRVLVDMKDLEFPVAYSQNACDIIASKYFRKAGVGGERDYEHSMRQVAHRMVDFWVAALIDEGIVDEGEKSQILYDELVYCLLAQMYAPNSPQWFNTGLKRSYGIKGGKSGNFYYDPELEKVVQSEDDYTRTQASACFIVSIEDKLLGSHSISDQYVTETKLFKGGSGTGTNFSPIRAEGERLSGGGVSSGLMSFLKGLDRNAGAIKSGGTTRRAAKMVCLDIDHPEVENFISWKAKEEDKVAALAKMGYDADIDGEAYHTVSGQNSNNSLRISDEFMQKVMSLEENPDATLELKGRLDESVNRRVKVKDLWDLMNESAWRCADPAPQFSGIFNEWHTCPAGEDGQVWAKHNQLNSTNPCGEYAFLDDTSCNLASINVYSFYDPEKRVFDMEGYVHLVSLCQLFLEGSIIGGQFPTEDIARRTYLFRTTGLGLSNLASLLMVAGVPYDSEQGRNMAAALAGILTGRSYAVSALMAAQAGPFPKYEINKTFMQRVIRNHARVAGARSDAFEDLSYRPLIVDHNLLKQMDCEEFSDTLKDVWSEALTYGDQYGYRNAQVSVMAPTGTISFAMDCGATSIEPFFSHIVYKKLSGGGFMTLTNPVIGVALHNLGYSEEEVQDIMDYVGAEENGMIIDGKIEGAPHLKEEHYAIFDTANTCGSGKRYIAHTGHVLMVAAITPLISGAISKTVNLPNDATVDDFKQVLIDSWQTGVKGITLYRDGSKQAQPLNKHLQDIDDVENLENLTYDALLHYAKGAKQALNQPRPTSRRSKLKGIRSGHTHPAQIDDVKIYTTVNRNEFGDISEIYITTDREGTLIMGLLNSLSKTISVMLQYHIPAHNISKMLRGQQYEPYGFVRRHPYIKYATSISDLISKIIDIELGDFSRCQVKPEQAIDVQPIPPLLPTKPVAKQPEYLTESNDDEHDSVESSLYAAAFVHESAREAIAHGERLYDGSMCSNCSSVRMVKNGTCKVCLDCGTTTGCS
ncbi:MAG: vitamin B12-dependent ribonucleotide reductase [Fastidiosipilaceae bacterium]